MRPPPPPTPQRISLRLVAVTKAELVDERAYLCLMGGGSYRILMWDARYQEFINDECIMKPYPQVIYALPL